MHFREVIFSIEESIEIQREFVLQFKAIDFNLESILDSGTTYVKDSNPVIIATTKQEVNKTKNFTI